MGVIPPPPPPMLPVKQTQLCNTVAGILLGTLILLCMIPLVTSGFLGYHTQAFISIPCGLAASALLAAFIGGIPAIVEGIIAASITVFILGGWVKKAQECCLSFVVTG